MHAWMHAYMHVYVGPMYAFIYLYIYIYIIINERGPVPARAYHCYVWMYGISSGVMIGPYAPK